MYSVLCKDKVKTVYQGDILSDRDWYNVLRNFEELVTWGGSKIYEKDTLLPIFESYQTEITKSNSITFYLENYIGEWEILLSRLNWRKYNNIFDPRFSSKWSRHVCLSKSNKINKTPWIW